MAAYVYLIEEEPYPGETSGPWTKIGYSQNPPEWRMDANLKRGNPRNIRVAAAFAYETSQDARAAERSAHEHFGDLKHQKEWFRASWTEVAAWMEGTGAKLRVKDPGIDA
jgi:T5orf172 domain